MQPVSSTNPYLQPAKQQHAKPTAKTEITQAQSSFDIVQISPQAREASQTSGQAGFEISTTTEGENQALVPGLIIGIGKKDNSVLKLLTNDGQHQTLQQPEGEGSKFLKFPLTMKGDPNNEWSIFIGGSSALGSNVNSLEELLKQGINPLDLDYVKTAINSLLQSHSHLEPQWDLT